MRRIRSQRPELRSSPPLGDRDVHVWKAPLHAMCSQLEAMRRTLSDDEERRALRFHFERDRDAFIVARGTLRCILAKYLDVLPIDIRFEYGKYGKPRLALPNPGDVQFNLSHSGELALVGVSRGLPIGVDIEQRRELDFLPLAESFFTVAELIELRSLPESEQYDGFLNCWTRKEAYLKAQGEGLSMRLDSFSVSLKPGEKAMLTWTRSGSEEFKRWDVHSVPLARNHVGAVVTKRPASPCALFDWGAVPLRGR